MRLNNIGTPNEAGRRRGCGLSTFLGLGLIVVIGGLAALGAALPEGESGLAGLLVREPNGPRVGLIAGHWQSDSGTVCPDGLQEVEVNLAVARATVELLRVQGYRAEVLAEFDPALDAYQAAALVSIHCDSCLSDLSGFKVARSSSSAVPETEDRLVQALYTAYQAETGLAPHLNTITEDMRQYHAFGRIAPETPGAIIETGFLGGDRHLLTAQQDRVARGIAEGIVAFLAPSP
jgi:N-acetylmuramoyl-L-alanine amidase